MNYSVVPVLVLLLDSRFESEDKDNWRLRYEFRSRVCFLGSPMIQ